MERDDPRVAYGKKVRAKRESMQISLRDFAKKIEISPTYLSKIERGEFPPPTEDRIVFIAECLDAGSIWAKPPGGLSAPPRR